MGTVYRVVDSHSVRRAWAERSGEYSPDYYAYYGPDETSDALVDALDRIVDWDARVLELGCSSGRHLAHLHEQGYEDLSSIEINQDAVKVIAQSYPELAETAAIHVTSFQEKLPEFEDDAFDVAFSVESLQHVPPGDDWLFAELARVAETIVTVENEHGTVDGGDVSPGDVTYVNDDLPLYHRNWHAIFSDLGFDETETRDLGRLTLRVFTTPE